MERLTYRAEIGVSIDKNEDCPSCNICWNCNIPPRECKYISDALKKLADYEDLEEHGRLIKLPCKTGDTVYIAEKDILFEAICIGTHLDEYVNGIWINVKEYPDNSWWIPFKDFGKTVFLTKAEAEAKLKELRGGENESSN